MSSQTKTTFSKSKKQKFQGWNFLRAKNSRAGQNFLQVGRCPSLLRGPRSTSSPSEGLVRSNPYLHTLSSIAAPAVRARVTPLPRPGHLSPLCAVRVPGPSTAAHPRPTRLPLNQQERVGRIASSYLVLPRIFGMRPIWGPQRRRLKRCKVPSAPPLPLTMFPSPPLHVTGATEGFR